MLTLVLFNLSSHGWKLNSLSQKLSPCYMSGSLVVTVLNKTSVVAGNPLVCVQKALEMHVFYTVPDVRFELYSSGFWKFNAIKSSKSVIDTIVTTQASFRAPDLDGPQCACVRFSDWFIGREKLNGHKGRSLPDILTGKHRLFVRFFSHIRGLRRLRKRLLWGHRWVYPFVYLLKTNFAKLSSQTIWLVTRAGS